VTAAVKRRGEIRLISFLPASPGGAEVMEVEVAGVPYQRAVPTASAGSPFWNRTACQLTMAQPVGASGFTDDTGKVVTVAGGVVGVADGDVPGGLCANFLGAGGQLSLGNNQDFLFTTLNYGIEGFFKSTQAAQQFTTLAEKDNGAFGSSSWALLFNVDTNADGKIAFYHSDFAGQVAKTVAGGFNNGVRHHVYVARLGQTFEIWVDGVRANGSDLIQGTQPVGSANTGVVRFGNSRIAGRDFVGHMDNWRIIRGALPYTRTPFTVPTVPFPTS
jgi:hypothetical protein